MKKGRTHDLIQRARKKLADQAAADYELHRVRMSPRRLSFIALTAGAILTLLASRGGWPFLGISWFTTWGHEFSHAMAGVLTGASVHNLVILPTGDGATDTRGGAEAFIAWAGYPGGMLWGAVLWRMGDRARQWLAFAVGGAIAVSAVFWSTSMVTSGVLLAIIAMVGVPRILPWPTAAAVWMKVLGATVFIFNWWRLIGLWIIDVPNDAMILESLTLVKSDLWMGTWAIMAVLITIWVVQGEVSIWAGKRVRDGRGRLRISSPEGSGPLP